MNKLLKKIIYYEKVTEDDIEEALEGICEDEHYSCSDRCPVYEMNNHSVVKDNRDIRENRGCLCFKSGRAMRNFILDKIIKEKKK
jgi:hypothetical protein